MRYQELSAGPVGLAAVTPGPDLSAHGYAEREYVAHGSVERWVDAALADPAPIATRVLVRAPREPAAFSGVVVVEWLNVSSGADAAPDWTYLAAEIVRRGHAWVGVSAQMVGAVGGPPSVGGEDSPGLRGTDPERYGDLVHPGDAYADDLFTRVGRTIDAPGAPLAGLAVRRRIAVGESQSAFALTGYLARHARAAHGHGAYDAYLVHSRGRTALGPGEPGHPHRLDRIRAGDPVHFPDDLERPVLCVQTETDVLAPRFDFRAARQPDGPWLRTWEVAGAAHADHWQIGEFEDLLGCPEPVNRGQQAYVLRAALRHLERWDDPPCAVPLEIAGEAFVLDEVGNVRGGVRTPCVEAPTAVLTGLAAPGSSVLCSLFGATRSLPAPVLRERYGSVAGYRTAYVRATDAAIAAGFVLAEDREEILAEARPDLVGQ